MVLSASHCCSDSWWLWKFQNTASCNADFNQATDYGVLSDQKAQVFGSHSRSVRPRTLIRVWWRRLGDDTELGCICRTQCLEQFLMAETSYLKSGKIVPYYLQLLVSSSGNFALFSQELRRCKACPLVQASSSPGNIVLKNTHSKLENPSGNCA